MNIFNFIVFLVIELASAEPTVVKDGQKNFVKKIQAPAVGQIVLTYKYLGEPVSRPAVLIVSVQCEGLKKPVPAETVEMCSLENYEYISPEKSIRLKLKSSRVDSSGKVSCDVESNPTLNLGQFCTDYFRKKQK